MEKFDLVVIGAGPGGYVAAIKAAQQGLRVACIDKHHSLGGTCLNVGCIPSKTLLYSSELLYKIKQQGEELGLIVPEVKFDFDRMMKRKNQVVHSLTEGVAGIFKHQHIQFIQGEASFIDANSLKVKQPSGEMTIEATNFLIATGSAPASLPKIPFSGKRVISSTEALSLPNVPKSLLIIGGGVIGVELASVYSRLGTKVTVIEMLPMICPAMEKEISKFLLNSLKKQGINFLLSTEVLEGKEESDKVTLKVKNSDGEQNLEGDYALVAIGRKPYTDKLDLAKAGIETDKRGFIPVDNGFRTKQPNIMAIGDVTEGVMLAHRASEEGISVAEALMGKNYPIDYVSIPNVIYTSPEVASIGLTEAEGYQASLSMDIGTANFKGNPRARCTDEMEGFVKIIGDRKSGKLIGMHIIGPHASELIAQGVVALSERMTLDQIAHQVYAHPTLSEIIKEAAFNALGKPLHG